MQRRLVASAVVAVMFAILAAGWTFEEGMQEGSENREEFGQALGPKSPLYRRILVELGRITEVKVTRECGSPKQPPISCAGVYTPQGASLPTTEGFRGLLYLSPDHLKPAMADAQRRFLIHHELGHIVDFALVPDALDKAFLALFRRSPKWKSCYPQPGFAKVSARSPCIAYMEIFADQFAYWSTPPGEPDPSITYGLPRLATTAEFQAVMARSPLEDLRDPSIFDRRRG